MLHSVDQERIPSPITRPKGERRPQGILLERDHSYLGGFDHFNEEDFHRMRVGYYASIALFDLEVGRVLRALDDQGLADNTLVLFASDHGDMLGITNCWSKAPFFTTPASSYR